MKIETDKYGRRVYKFSHSVAQGGYLYAHKTKEGKISNKEGLRNLLNALAKKYELIEVTIKVYENIFFLFFQIKPSLKSADLIDNLQAHIDLFGLFDDTYILTGVYDLQEKYVRKDLERFGYDYDKG